MTPLTFKQLKTRILQRSRMRFNLLDPDDDETQGETNLGQMINFWKNAMLDMHEFRWKKGVMSLATAGKFSHNMPDDVQAVTRAWIPANGWTLNYRDIGSIREEDPELSTTGDPEVWTHPGSATDIAQIGFWPVGSVTLVFEYKKLFRDIDDNEQTLVNIGIPNAIVRGFEAALVEFVNSEIRDYNGDKDGALMALNMAKMHFKTTKDVQVGESNNAFSMQPVSVNRTFSGPRLGSNYPRQF